MEGPRRMTGHMREERHPQPPPEALRILTSSPDRFTSPTLGRLRLAAATAEKQEHDARKRAARPRKDPHVNAPAPTHLRAVRPERPGDRVDCTCLRARHEHGTIHAYRSDGCRCLSCRAAQAQARRTWEKQRHVGRADSAVSADRVRAHVRELMDLWGVPGPDIARAAVAALLRRADHANTQQTATDTEQQPAGQTREERRTLMQELYGYEGTVTASLMEITDLVTDLSLEAAAGMPDTEDAARALLTHANTLTDLLDRTVGDYPATIPGELRTPIYQLGDRIRDAAGTISRTPTTDPTFLAACGTASRLLRAWADTVQRITL